MIDFETGLPIVDVCEVVDIDWSPVIDDACCHFDDADSYEGENSTFIKHFFWI